MKKQLKEARSLNPSREVVTGTKLRDEALQCKLELNGLPDPKTSVPLGTGALTAWVARLRQQLITQQATINVMADSIIKLEKESATKTNLLSLVDSVKDLGKIVGRLVVGK